MTVNKRVVVFVSFFLAGCCLLGNFKIVSSQNKYIANVEMLKDINIDGVERYFEKSSSMSKEKVIEFVSISSQRDLEQAYIKPWYYFQIFIFNLALFVTGYAVYLKAK